MKDEKINKECRFLCRQLVATQRNLNWNQNEMFRVAYNARIIDPNLDLDYDDDDENKMKQWCAKYKKLFQREPWKHDKATQGNLDNLKELWHWVCKSSKYRQKCGKLRPQLISGMKKISENLEKEIRKQYDQE